SKVLAPEPRGCERSEHAVTNPRLVSICRTKRADVSESPILGNWSVKKCADYIRVGKNAKFQTEKLRLLLAEGDQNEASKFKKKMIAAMVSGTFRDRGDNELIEHSGLLCADLDHLGERLPEIREKLKASPHVCVLFVSPSGDGLK